MATELERTLTMLDVAAVRRNFPALGLEVHGKPLAYLDNAASAHKPLAVLDAETRFQRESYSNVHRGVHYLSQKATTEYEAARATVAGFINAPSESEVVFLRGTTEAVNLVASSWGRANLGPGDEVLITAMEHHSNIVPWQMITEETGATLKVAPIDDDGDVVLEELDRLLTEKTKIFSFIHVSNALGTINPAREMIEMAKSRGAVVFVDGAQAAPHLPVDVQALDCDFYAFSSHKLFGPTGIGALWGRRELLDAMPPYQGGGEMIRTVSFEKTEYADVPHKFEAGTPNIVGSVGFGAAIDFYRGFDSRVLAEHEHNLLLYATMMLKEIPGVRLIGTAKRKASLVSFVIDGIHAHDVGTFLDREGVAVRVGHHCAQPVMDRYEVPATARASFAFYNTRDEVDRLAAAARKTREFFAR